MEGAPLTNKTDSEDNFTPKKSKSKRERFDPLEDDAAALHRRRHIAREIVRHEEVERPEQPQEHRRQAPEATQLHGEEKSPEHIGRMLVTAEAHQERREAPRTPYTPEKAQLRPGTRVETLSRAELLTFSELIAVETTSLRNVYETHLIGEQALRRLIAEYLQGHDIHAALQREILEHEIDFERDPALRDNTVTADDKRGDTTQLIAPGKESLNQLLQKAQSVIGFSDSDEFNYAQDRAHGHHQRPLPVRPQRRPVDVIMAITIVLLVILVLVLLFGRH
jgi:hypothetical protein